MADHKENQPPVVPSKPSAPTPDHSLANTQALFVANDRVRELEREVRDLKDVVKELLVDKARQERRESNKKIVQDNYRLGKMDWKLGGSGFVKNWVEGTEIRDITQHIKDVQEQRKVLEERERRLNKKKKWVSCRIWCYCRLLGCRKPSRRTRPSSRPPTPTRWWSRTSTRTWRS